jgi:RND superfamily putative drug exporter
VVSGVLRLRTFTLESYPEELQNDDEHEEEDPMLERLATWSYVHRWRMLLLWVVALVGFLIFQLAAGGNYATDFSLPGTESQAAFDLLQQHFRGQSGDTATVVFEATQGVDNPSVRQTMEGMFAELAKLPHVDGVDSPYAAGGGEQQISRDGTIAFATVRFNVQPGEVGKPEADNMIALGDQADRSGLRVEVGGSVIQNAEFEPPGGAEAYGLGAAVIILLITFGSLLAMGLPILIALFGISIGLSLVLLMANFLNVPNFTPQLASMIGIGVGIDYALFIVTRYRQGLGDGLDPEAAVAKAMDTAGRAVVFAGTIVVISFLGILLMGFAFVQGIAVGGAATVFVTMLASITLLPAVLGFVGRNIDKLHIPRLRRVETTGHQGFWYRWSRLVQRRPWVAFIFGLAVLVTLTLPMFRLRLGFADAGNDPPTASSRQTYDLLTKGFGPGFNAPMVLAAQIRSPQDLTALDGLSQKLRNTAGVAAVSPPIANPKGDTAILQLFPSTSPQDSATSDLVRRLRNEVIPQAMNGTGVHVLVGGLTAAATDFAQKTASRLPVLIGVVIGLSFLLLMIVFRSIVVPIKAAIMNLLSIGAAYGTLVAVFQWGWLKNVVGIGKPGPIEAWAPMMLFAILFGLSMDYEIFLLSRIREDYLRTKDNATSVANGVASTGRVITAAGAIMVAVFLSFVIGFPARQIKLFGLGLAVAVLVDATLVRMVLVPATMELLGNANWWFPKWLARLVPEIHIESEVTPVAEREAAFAGVDGAGKA